MADRPAQQLGQLLKEFVAVLMKQSTGDMLRVMRREELSMPQVVTLFYLRHARTASISAVREHLNLSLAATSHLVDRLVVGGFVSRTENTADRRHKQLTLTDTGLALIDELDQVRTALVARRLNDMPPEVLHATIEALRNAITYLDASGAQAEDQPAEESHAPTPGSIQGLPITRNV